MRRRIASLAIAVLMAGPSSLRAQDFKILSREVQVHGWISQGFVYTNQNNWLTMNTSSGSGAMTDMGLNVSSQLTDNFRVGAQVFDRNLGQLGQYHPSLDWAVADYRFKSWLSFRGGKVKTVLGLFNDTQDQSFLHSFALLPQSVYPIDLRDATAAHLGGDLYGTVQVRRNLGSIVYTVYAGHRSDSIYSGYPYLLTQYAIFYRRFGGLQYGADLRWRTPAKGLTLGVSRQDQDTSATGTAMGFPAPNQGPPGVGSNLTFPAEEHSKQDWTNQFYADFSRGRLRLNSEYRRYLRDQIILSGTGEDEDDIRGWYAAGTYRLNKRVQIGSYYSRYTISSTFGGFTDTSLPRNHIYDKVVAGNIQVNSYTTLKIEGHFMDGYGNAPYPEGFYGQVNLQGFKPTTNALVVKSSFRF